MAAVSVILTDTREQSTMVLALSPYSMSYSDINLSRCHQVLENGHYRISFYLNLPQLQNEIALEDDLDSEDLSFGAKRKSETVAQLPEVNANDPFAYIYGTGHETNEPLSLLRPSGEYKRITGIFLYINDEQTGYFDYAIKEDKPHEIFGKATLDSQTLPSASQPFLMHYDAVRLRIRIVLEDGQQLNMYSDYLLCTCSAEDNRNISKILEELSSLNDSEILDLMFMQNELEERFTDLSNRLIKEHRAYTSLQSYIDLIAHIIDCYQKQYSIFMATAKHTLIKGYELQSFESVRAVTHKNHQWLMRNPEVLCEANNVPYGVNINGRKYLPSRMQGEVTKKSFDTPENRSVIGFIRMVMLAADKVHGQYMRSLADQMHLMGTISDGNDDSPQAPIIAVKGIQQRIYRNMLATLKGQIETLNRIYLSYSKIFGIRDAVLQKRPLKSKVFREIKPYAAVYSVISSYFFYGQFDASKDFLMFQVNRLDKLFEYYCLYRLIGMLLSNGFKPSEEKLPYSYRYQLGPNQLSEEEPIANTYYFNRGKQRIVLYYQPVISSFTFENGIRAFRTTASNHNDINPYSWYTPDFMMKVSSDDNMLWDDDYLIFDSKFSNPKTIERHYIDDLKKKYADETTIAVLKKRAIATSQQDRFGQAESLYTNPGLSTSDGMPQHVSTESSMSSMGTNSTLAAPSYTSASSGLATSAMTAAPSDSSVSAPATASSATGPTAAAPSTAPAAPAPAASRTTAPSIHEMTPKANTRGRENFKDEFMKIINKFELVRVKAPKMVFALQGRVMSDIAEANNKAEALANPALAATSQRPEATTQATAEPAVHKSHISLYHNSPLALRFRPVTTIGMVEISTRIDTMPELWQEIVHVLPYLKQA